MLDHRCVTQFQDSHNTEVRCAKSHEGAVRRNRCLISLEAISRDAHYPPRVSVTAQAAALGF